MVSARLVLIASAAVAAASQANAVQLRGGAEETILGMAPFDQGKALVPPLKARFQGKSAELSAATKHTLSTVQKGKAQIGAGLNSVQKVNNANSADTRGVVQEGQEAINLALKEANEVYEETTQASKKAAKESEEAAIASRAAVVAGQKAMQKSMNLGKKAMAKLWADEEEANKQAALATAKEVARASEAARAARQAAEEGMQEMNGAIDEAREANKEAASTTTTSSKKGDLALKEELLKTNQANKAATTATLASVNQANQAMQDAMKFALKQALVYGRDSVAEVKKAAKEVIEHIEGHLAAEAAQPEPKTVEDVEPNVGPKTVPKNWGPI